MAKAQITLGNLKASMGLKSEEEKACREALRILEELAVKPPPSLEIDLSLVTVRNNRAVALSEIGRTREAEALYRQNIQLCEKRLRRASLSGNERYEYRSKLALNCANLAPMLAKAGRRSEAMQVWHKGLAIREQSVREFPSTPWHFLAVGDALCDMADFHFAHGEFAQARPLLEKALCHTRRAVALAPEGPGGIRLHRDCWSKLSETLLQLKEHAEAGRLAGELVQLFPESASDRIQAAAVLARCVALAQADSRLSTSPQAELARAYGDRAVAVLQEAAGKAGHDFGSLAKDARFAAIRSRPDFQKLLRPAP
jgi:tetratricopeptide (TPR) repeat protein